MHKSQYSQLYRNLYWKCTGSAYTCLKINKNQSDFPFIWIESKQLAGWNREGNTEKWAALKNGYEISRYLLMATNFCVSSRFFSSLCYEFITFVHEYEWCISLTVTFCEIWFYCNWLSVGIRATIYFISRHFLCW